jgi:hypothetical protein
MSIPRARSREPKLDGRIMVRQVVIGRPRFKDSPLLYGYKRYKNKVSIR